MIISPVGSEYENIGKERERDREWKNSFRLSGQRRQSERSFKQDLSGKAGTQNICKLNCSNFFNPLRSNVKCEARERESERA